MSSFQFSCPQCDEQWTIQLEQLPIDFHCSKCDLSGEIALDEDELEPSPPSSQEEGFAAIATTDSPWKKHSSPTKKTPQLALQEGHWYRWRNLSFLSHLTYQIQQLPISQRQSLLANTPLSVPTVVSPRQTEVANTQIRTSKSHSYLRAVLIAFPIAIALGFLCWFAPKAFPLLSQTPVAITSKATPQTTSSPPKPPNSSALLSQGETQQEEESPQEEVPQQETTKEHKEELSSLALSTTHPNSQHSANSDLQQNQHPPSRSDLVPSPSPSQTTKQPEKPDLLDLLEPENGLLTPTEDTLTHRFQWLQKLDSISNADQLLQLVDNPTLLVESELNLEQLALEISSMSRMSLDYWSSDKGAMRGVFFSTKQDHQQHQRNYYYLWLLEQENSYRIDSQTLLSQARNDLHNYLAGEIVEPRELLVFLEPRNVGLPEQFQELNNLGTILSVREAPSIQTPISGYLLLLPETKKPANIDLSPHNWTTPKVMRIRTELIHPELEQSPLWISEIIEIL